MKFVNFLKNVFIKKFWIKLCCLILAVFAAAFLNV